MRKRKENALYDVEKSLKGVHKGPQTSGVIRRCNNNNLTTRLLVILMQHSIGTVRGEAFESRQPIKTAPRRKKYHNPAIGDSYRPVLLCYSLHTVYFTSKMSVATNPLFITE